MLYISCIDLLKNGKFLLYTNRLSESDVHVYSYPEFYIYIYIKVQVVQCFQTFSITCRKISMRKQLKNSSKSSRRKPTQVPSVSLETW